MTYLCYFLHFLHVVFVNIWQSWERSGLKQPWADVACVQSLHYLPVISQHYLLPSLHHWLIEDSDSVPGMMLSNCCAETDLHNQTIRGKMGHLGKQLFLKLLACFWTICPHSLHCFLTALMSYQCIATDVWITIPTAFGDVMYTWYTRCWCWADVFILLLLLKLQVQINRTFNLLLIHKCIYLFPWCT